MIRHFTTNSSFLAVLEFLYLNRAFTLTTKKMCNILKRFYCPEQSWVLISNLWIYVSINAIVEVKVDSKFILFIK